MISVCILTKNVAPFLEKTLDRLILFPQVLILDNGSTDQTLEIAKKYPNVTLIETPFIGFGPLRNQAAKLAKYDWILAIDSDEILSSDLLHELQNLVLKPACVYSIPRHNFFNQKWIRGAGWHPEKVIRLYNKKDTGYSNHEVHESVLKKNLSVITLKNPIFHTPYRSISDFLQKMELYTTLFAKQNEGKKSSFLKAYAHGFYAFFKSYILQRGFLCGGEGLTISLYNGHTAFYKYVKLLELGKINCKEKK